VIVRVGVIKGVRVFVGMAVCVKVCVMVGVKVIGVEVRDGVDVNVIVGVAVAVRWGTVNWLIHRVARPRQ